MKGSLELQNGGLRALEEAWDDFLLEAFFCQVWSFSVPGYPKEEGLLDFLGRLRPADSSVQMSRLVSTLFLAQNAFLRDANSGKIISESSSMR